jgi:nucleoside-diphosphate-sugar epimerase
MATAFVAGASGYTGREVVRGLIARGVETVAHVRADSPKLAALTREFEAEGAIVDATAWDEVAFRTTLGKLRPNLVFALLGTTRARARATEHAGGTAESYESVDYGLTARLLRASVASAARPRFGYLSSLGGGRPSKNAYLAGRDTAEGDLRASGLNYVIARPTYITGPDRAEARPAERTAASVADALLGIAGHLGGRRLRDRYASMTAAELAAALIVLATEDRPAVVAETAELREAASRAVAG